MWARVTTLPAALAILAAQALVTGDAAAAATCADRPVTARGDPSRFEVIAKTNARANWRAKVRSMPALGAAYANWSRALAAEYQCSQQDGFYLCTAVAHPCRD
jgi:hypothetical protein